VWILLADHPDARRIVEHALTEHAIHPLAFLINLVAVVTWEIRLHAKLPDHAERDRRLAALNAD
jgi:hypothetical protein